MTDRRPIRRQGRIVVWATVGALAVFALVRAFRPTPVLVDTAEVTRGTMRVLAEDDGRTRVRDRFTISAPVQGLLLRSSLDEGDAVRAGETVVAELLPVNPDPLDLRARREAEARLLRATAALEEAEARREQAAAELRFASAELARMRQLQAEGIVAQEEFERALRDERALTEAVDAASHAVDVARYEVETARATLLEGRAFDTDALRLPSPAAAPAERSDRVEAPPANLAPDAPAAASESRSGGESPQFLEALDGRLVIRSPIDGRVLRVFEESARTLAAGTPIRELGDTERLEIVADYLSQEAVKVSPGMDVIVRGWGGETASGLEKVLRGTVRLVEPAGFTKVSALGVEEQRVNVVVDPLGAPEAWAAIGDGFRVELGIVLWQGDDVVIVPTGALFREAEAWSVFVVDRQRARRRKIEIGHVGDLEAEVISGLEPGETVVVYPSELISDGARVEPH